MGTNSQIWVLSLTSCVILRKSLNFSELISSSVKNGENSSYLAKLL